MADPALADLLARMRRLKRLVAELEAECERLPDLRSRVRAMQDNLKKAIQDLKRLLALSNR